MSVHNAVEAAVINRLKGLPDGYLVNSPNLIFDIGLNTDDKRFDGKVYNSLSSVARNNKLESFGRRLKLLGSKPMYSRGNKRPTNLYKVIVNADR